MDKIEMDKLIQDFTDYVMEKAQIKENYNIRDYDLDRVYLDVGDSTDNYTIRMWCLNKSFIRYTLFRTVENYGVPVIESQVYRINRSIE